MYHFACTVYIFYTLALEEPTPVDLAVLESLLKMKKNVIIKLEGREDIVNALGHYIPKEKYAILLKFINNQDNAYRRTYTTHTNKHFLYWDSAIECLTNVDPDERMDSLRTTPIMSINSTAALPDSINTILSSNETHEEVNERLDSEWSEEEYISKWREAKWKVDKEMDDVESLLVSQNIVHVTNPENI
uniref:Ankyrin repeat protein n=1 Tax=Parastrongyloides trichosuri TaxID=131310 RepID=A0A0N4ZLL2_PARTI